MYLRRLVLYTAVMLTAGGIAAAQVRSGADIRQSRRDADAMKQKVRAINERGATAPKERHERYRTLVTENEVNAYLALDALPDLPTGVRNPSVAILGPGKLSGSAVVDLDAVRKESPPKSLLDPRNLLIGRVPIAASGTLTTMNGVGRFALESATVGGLPLPKLLLQEILTYYSRTPAKPGGISLDDPFELPVQIREIQVVRGQALVIQ